jgi:hypothetical protein
MNKVVIERTRYGGKGGSRKTYEKASLPREKRSFKGVDVDLRPKRESMRKKHRVNGDAKEFSDLLGPLRGYLLSKVGEPWDDVWSDICSVLKGNSLQAAHIKGHVKQMVGGIPHSGESYFDGRWHEQGYDPVYVDEDGIVQKGKDRNWRREKEVFHYYRESDTVEYHKLNGAWFRVEIGCEEKERRWQGWGGYWHTRGYTYYYPLSKKALSKKDIKKLRLNDRTETVAPKLTLEEKDGDNRTDR